MPLDSACRRFAAAAGLAAGQAVGEEGEEGDDALWVCLLVAEFFPNSLFLGLTLMMALQTVTMALTMAMKQDVMAETRELNWGMSAGRLFVCAMLREGGSHAGCDGAHCCGVGLFVLLVLMMDLVFKSRERAVVE